MGQKTIEDTLRTWAADLRANKGMTLVEYPELPDELERWADEVHRFRVERDELAKVISALRRNVENELEEPSELDMAWLDGDRVLPEALRAEGHELAALVVEHTYTLDALEK